MRWLTERAEWRIGPAGLRIDGVLRSHVPLLPGELERVLAALPDEQPRPRRLIVDDAWVRVMLIDQPAGLGRAERQALIGHRAQEIFDAALAARPWAAARRNSQPWAGWRQPAGGSLHATLLPDVAAALGRAWQGRAGKLPPIVSSWSEALARLPATRQGALALCHGGRLSVAAWGEGRWLGWRSFVCAGVSDGEAELQRWLSALDWPAEQGTIWCAGWAPAGAASGMVDWRQLPAGGRPLRPAAFVLAAGTAQPGWPLRRRLIALAAVLTLLASVYVSLPEAPTADDAAVVAALPARPAPLEAPAPETDSAPALEASEPDETPVAWPTVLGIYESAGRRRVLYDAPSGAASASRGQLIDRRFRVERLAASQLTLFDTVTQERRQIELDSPGVQP